MVSNCEKGLIKAIAGQRLDTDLILTPIKMLRAIGAKGYVDPSGQRLQDDQLWGALAYDVESMMLEIRALQERNDAQDR